MKHFADKVVMARSETIIVSLAQSNLNDTQSIAMISVQMDDARCSFAGRSKPAKAIVKV